MEAEEGRAAIWEIDRKTGAHRVFASGLRNPNGMAWEPATGALWTVVNERDELGSDLVPDYLTSVRDGGFYGWPYSYYGQHVDERVQAAAAGPGRDGDRARLRAGRAHRVAGARARARRRAAAGAHASGMFVGQHGSWNRKPPSGYKVIFVPFAGGKPAGKPVDVLTGFLSAEGDAYGRPVGVAIDGRGRCWSPTTSATPSGASPVRGDWRRRCCPPTSRSRLVQSPTSKRRPMASARTTSIGVTMPASLLSSSSTMMRWMSRFAISVTAAIAGSSA